MIKITKNKYVNLAVTGLVIGAAGILAANMGVGVAASLAGTVVNSFAQNTVNQALQPTEDQYEDMIDIRTSFDVDADGSVYKIAHV